MKFVKPFNFSGKIPGFSKKIELCLNFSTKFDITLLVLSNHNKISPQKNNFILTTQATLRILLGLISENTKKLHNNFLKVQTPCFVQNLEACRILAFLLKNLCNEAMNEATFELQTIEDVLYQKRVFIQKL